MNDTYTTSTETTTRAETDYRLAANLPSITPSSYRLAKQTLWEIMAGSRDPQTLANLGNAVVHYAFGQSRYMNKSVTGRSLPGALESADHLPFAERQAHGVRLTVTSSALEKVHPWRSEVGSSHALISVTVDAEDGQGARPFVLTPASGKVSHKRRKPRRFQDSQGPYEMPINGSSMRPATEIAAQVDMATAQMLARTVLMVHGEQLDRQVRKERPEHEPQHNIQIPDTVTIDTELLVAA